MSTIRGASERPADGTVWYHGSRVRLRVLEPQSSSLLDKPGVFVTSSYRDAVIFAAGWTDYNFAMWGGDDSTVRYLDEQYPGAFEKLDCKGYIHYIRGAPRELKGGLGNEYYFDCAQTPFQVDEVNVGEQLRATSPRELRLRDYATVLADRKSTTRRVSSPSIVCVIVCFDTDAVCDILRANGITPVRPAYDNIHERVDGPIVVVGDPYNGSEIIEAPCNVYLQEDIMQIATQYKSPKTSQMELFRYLMAMRERSHDHLWISRAEDFVQNVIMKQLELRKMNKRVIHVTGPPGSGKTTLAARVIEAGVSAIDTDDITDTPGVGDVYKKLGDVMSSCGDIVVIVGHTINVSILANELYLLNTDWETTYNRLLQRTVASICDNMSEIKDLSIRSREEFDRVVTRYKIRFPGFLPPDQYKISYYDPFVDGVTRDGCVLVGPNDVLARILGVGNKGNMSH